MEITKKLLKQVIKEELSRVLFERAMTEQQTDPDNPGMTQAPEEPADNEDPNPGPQSKGCPEGQVQTGTNEDGTPICGDKVAPERGKKKGPSKLSGEAHKYRRYVNGLKKRGKIDDKGWKTLRRALHKMDMTSPDGKSKFNQLLRKVVTGGAQAAGERSSAASAAAGGKDFEKQLAAERPGQYHGNSITNPELKARYIAKVKELAKDPKVTAAAKGNALRLRNTVFRLVNKMMADGTL